MAETLLERRQKAGKPLDVLTATYRIVTPMFLGGADQEPDGIRPASVKGALRFWWRALSWGRVLKKFGNDEAAALRQLHCEEGKLFGLSSRKVNGEEVGGQGVFSLHITQQVRSQGKDDWPPATPNKSDDAKTKQKKKEAAGSSYMGFGLWETGSKEKGNWKEHRLGLPENRSFTLEIVFRQRLTASQRQQLEEALVLWGLFGGLGSRSRRGFGSVTIECLGSKKFLMNQEKYLQAVQERLTSAAQVNRYPPFTAFSAHSRFALFESNSDAKGAHNWAGKSYQSYRTGPELDTDYKKLPFGTPLQKIEKKRRASPLIFHVHRLRNGQCVVVALFLPAAFHPDIATPSLSNFYQPVVDFLEDYGEPVYVP